MTKEEAIKVLDKIVSQVAMGRAEHNRCVEALQVLQRLAEPKEKK